MTPPLSPRRADERAFLQAVVYASLFDYPLTPSQLRETLIGERADEATLMRWYRDSDYLQATVEFAAGYFFPRGRRDLIAMRARREQESRRLLGELAGPLTLLTHMPFVRMVALSGSLAHLNADADADLDLFVVTSARRVWTVALTAIAVAKLLGWRKRLCLNYLVSERALWVAPADLFSANQIVHLRPVTGADAYKQFLEANRFVTRFYPNFEPRAVRIRRRKWAAATQALESFLDWTVAPFIEPLCRWVYRTHLIRRAHTWASRDQVRLEPECLKLHTSSHRREVMERFERALDDAMVRAEQDAFAPAESRR